MDQTYQVYLVTSNEFDDGCRFYNAGAVQIVDYIASITITTPSLPDGYVGQAYSLQLAETGAPNPFWDGSGFPSGLSLDSSGLLSGTPSSAGTFLVMIRAREPPFYVTAQRQYFLTVH